MAAKKLAKPLISDDDNDLGDNEGEELIAIGDAGTALEEFESARPAAKPKKAEAEADPDAEAEEIEAGDERLGEGDEADEDADAARERKRSERKAQKERARAAKERTFKELRFYESRNAELERRLASLEPRIKNTEVATVDSRITYLQGELAKANQVMSAAMNSTDAQRGDHFSQALQIRDALTNQIAQLQYAKQNIQTTPEAAQNGNGNGTAPQQQAPAPDPRVVRFAKQWAKDNPWYHPGNRDEDTAVVMTIDDEVAKEGYDPKTKEYWDEFKQRVRDALPDRYEEDEDDDEPPVTRAKPKATPSGPRLTVGGQERPLRKNEVHISADRKQALIDAGLWDDPKSRNKMLKRFHEYDRTHAVAR